MSDLDSVVEKLLARMRKTASGEMVTFDKSHVAEVLAEHLSTSAPKGHCGNCNGTEFEVVERCLTCGEAEQLDRFDTAEAK
jgi:hypothetical protein